MDKGYLNKIERFEGDAQRYFDGKMNDQERQDFKSQVNADPELKENYRAERLLRMAAYLQKQPDAFKGKRELIQQIQHANERAKLREQRIRNIKWGGIFGGLLVLGMVAVFLLPSVGGQTPLGDDPRMSQLNSPMEFGIVPQETLYGKMAKDAIALSEAGEFKKAGQKFSEIPLAEKGRLTQYAEAANAVLAATTKGGGLAEAADRLAQMEDWPELRVHRKDWLYFRTLAALKLDDAENARDLLKKMEELEGDYLRDEMEVIKNIIHSAD